MPVEVETQDLARRLFRLGEWLVEPSLNRLSRGGTTIQLELKVMDVLVCLAERAGEVVPRQEIVDRVWATEFISDNTLTHAITEIRNALGDDARNPSFIETIHRRGYRLIAAVEPALPDEAAKSKVAGFPVPKGREIADEGRSPYPGLAAFTEADAEFFYGREAEVGQMWRRLTSRRLLAVIGPSGVGKSSFLRAGVIPAKPDGWGVVVCQPGEAPFAALARALVPIFGKDTEAVARLVGLRDPGELAAMVSRWRERHAQALLIVDQFEELLTLNPKEVQASFTDLLRRLVDESDVHVLLSMRDDFLYRCHDYESLAPVFDALSPLKAPTAQALHRALIEPARRLGFEFEDDELAGEMVSEVEGERGALPLLAFAVARLWEQRDRERRLMTREAYVDIGGVGGALGQHAEATLRAIGDDCLPFVREVFRNLVTSEGTRAVREAGELLSVFPEPRRMDAENVLRRLVDARLLTSFEEKTAEGEGHRRVEVVHESLLTSWPRLVGWQTQDADAARIRDELRQAARAWDDHARANDRLWTGSAYREFVSWRERYPGGLTELEEDFATAMTSFAQRRRRRRRVVVASALVFALALSIFFATLWRHGVREGRRAEGAKLVALGQLELESYPSSTVAHAIASLELADSPAARRLALEALWKGPTALVASEDPSYLCSFSADGRLIVKGVGLSRESDKGHLSILHADGSSEGLEHMYPNARYIWQSAITDSGHFVTSGEEADSVEKIVLWSVADRRPLAETTLDQSETVRDVAVDASLGRVLLLIIEGQRYRVDALGFDGTHELLGALDFEVTTDAAGLSTSDAVLDPWRGDWLGVGFQDGVYAVKVGAHELGSPRRLGRHSGMKPAVTCDSLGRFLVTASEKGEIRLWSPGGESPPKVLHGPPEILYFGVTTEGSLLEVIVEEGDEWIAWVWSLSENPPRPLRHFSLGKRGFDSLIKRYWGWRWDPSGRMVARWGPGVMTRIWSMDGPADAEPLALLRGDVVELSSVTFGPRSRWLASNDLAGLALWPLARPYPAVIRKHEREIFSLAFAPDGSWLASGGFFTIRLWPLEGDPPPPGRELSHVPGYDLAVSPDGERILAGSMVGEGPKLHFLNGGPPRTLPGFAHQTRGVAFSHDGRLAAAAGGQHVTADRVIRVWDLDSGEQLRLLEVGEIPYPFSLDFTPDGHLLSASESGLLQWDLGTGERRRLYEGYIPSFAVSRDGRLVLMVESEDSSDLWGRVVLLELDSGIVSHLAGYGGDANEVALDATGAVAAVGDLDGEVRVGPVTGEEPHLLVGHEGTVEAVAIDPLGRWVASGGVDATVRLWPMPDLSNPPLHTLPREELIAKLETLTNLRVVRDDDAPSGWKLEVGPFPGWETVPTW